jgi:hypothetical protein
MIGTIATGTIPMNLFNLRSMQDNRAGTHGLKVQALKEGTQILPDNTILPIEVSPDQPVLAGQVSIEEMTGGISRM